MRELTDHKSNALNEQLRILVADAPGPGGAHHDYRVRLPDGGHAYIKFQNGTVPEKGVNGITHEVLLAIVADRLRAFQAGPFACEENGMALESVVAALSALHLRTARRVERQVEGTHAA